MTGLFQLSTIETTYEDQAYGWTYRFIDNNVRGVLVKRTSTLAPLWSHGTLMQIFSITRRKFVPACTLDSIEYFPTLDAAKQTIEDFAFTEL